MSIDEKTLKEYYTLKQVQKQLEKKLKILNDKIKQDLEPGEYVKGKYKASLTLKRQVEIDETLAWNHIPSHIVSSCIKAAIDSDLVESAYLRGEITDDIMRGIRTSRVIPSLTVEKLEDENVQGDI